LWQELSQAVGQTPGISASLSVLVYGRNAGQLLVDFSSVSMVEDEGVHPGKLC
jgi:hypothetical protein